MSLVPRGVLIFAAASVGAGALIVLARRFLRDSPRAAAWATGAILGGACFAASVLSFTTPLSPFDRFGMSAIAIGLGLSWILGERRLAADSKVANEVSVVVFKLSGDEEADLKRSVEIMADLVERLRARGLMCSDARPIKPWGASFQCGSFGAVMDFGPSPGTLSISCQRLFTIPGEWNQRTAAPAIEERVRPLRELLAADERFTEQRWMSPAERHRLARESS